MFLFLMLITITYTFANVWLYMHDRFLIKEHEENMKNIPLRERLYYDDPDLLYDYTLIRSVFFIGYFTLVGRIMFIRFVDSFEDSYV